MQCFIISDVSQNTAVTENIMWFIVILKQLTQTGFVYWQSNLELLFIHVYTTTSADI